MHHGRHFGRTVHAFCNVSALVCNELLRLRALTDKPEEEPEAEEQLTNECVMASAKARSRSLQIDREQQEHRVFNLLAQMIPGIEDRLVEGTDEDMAHMVDLVSVFYVRISYAEVHPRKLARFKEVL